MLNFILQPERELYINLVFQKSDVFKLIWEFFPEYVNLKQLKIELL